MRKYKMLAVMMAVTMVGSIYSPIQAAGYCSNGNGSNCRIVVGDNCLDGSNYSNEALVKNILNNINCYNVNSVKGE